MRERFNEFLVKESDVAQEKASFCCSLFSLEASVSVRSDIKTIQANLANNLVYFTRVAPGFKVGVRPVASQQSIFILESDETGLFYDEQSRRVYLLGRAEDYIDGQSVAWVSYWLMEKQRQEKSFFTIHSSALATNGKGILLLGQSGAGKTSLLLDLCRKYPSTIVSNDLTVIRHDTESRKLMLVDGTKEIRLRLASVDRNFPALKHLFPENTTSAWESKVAVSPEDIGFKSEKEQPELRSIFEVYLDSKGTDSLLVRQERSIPIRYRLYEDMSRIIRGSAISVFDNNQNFLGYMPSLDSEETHVRRVACIEEMVDNIGIISVSGGDINEVSEAIYRIANH